MQKLIMAALVAAAFTFSPAAFAGDCPKDGKCPDKGAPQCDGKKDGDKKDETKATPTCDGGKKDSDKTKPEA